MSKRFEWEREVKASDMPTTRKLVLLTFATHVNKGGKAWPSQATLASECSLSDRAVRGHLAAAMEAGWLVRVRRGQKVGREPGKSVSSEYLIAFPNRNDASASNDVPTGTDVPAGNLQPEPDDLQPEPDDTPTGTGVPPISTRTETKDHSSHVPLPRERGPSETALGGDDEKKETQSPSERVPDLQIYEKAKKLGKRLASLTGDLDEVESLFADDRLLSRYPEVLHTTVTNWRTERIRAGLDRPKQVVY